MAVFPKDCHFLCSPHKTRPKDFPQRKTTWEGCIGVLSVPAWAAGMMLLPLVVKGSCLPESGLCSLLCKVGYTLRWKSNGDKYFYQLVSPQQNCGNIFWNYWLKLHKVWISLWQPGAKCAHAAQSGALDWSGETVGYMLGCSTVSQQGQVWAYTKAYFQAVWAENRKHPRRHHSFSAMGNGQAGDFRVAILVFGD